MYVLHNSCNLKPKVHFRIYNFKLETDLEIKSYFCGVLVRINSKRFIDCVDKHIVNLP